MVLYHQKQEHITMNQHTNLDQHLLQILYIRGQIIGNVKYYATAGNSKPVELKTLIPVARQQASSNTNSGNQGLVSPAGNEVSISGSGQSNIVQQNNTSNTAPNNTGINNGNGNVNTNQNTNQNQNQVPGGQTGLSGNTGNSVQPQRQTNVNNNTGISGNGSLR